MGAGKLLELAPGAADHAEHFAVQRHLEDPPRICASPTNITWFGPGVMQMELGAPMTSARRSPVGVLPLTARVPGSGGTSIVNMPQEFAVGIEYLDAPIRTVADVDVVVAVDRDRVRQAELAGTGSFVAPRLHPVAVACRTWRRAN